MKKILVKLDIFDELFYGHAKEKVAQIFLLHDVVIKYFDGVDQFFFVVGRIHELHAVTFFKMTVLQLQSFYKIWQM